MRLLATCNFFIIIRILIYHSRPLFLPATPFSQFLLFTYVFSLAIYMDFTSGMTALDSGKFAAKFELSKLTMPDLRRSTPSSNSSR
jgi:hypothetical protein